jgi:hypothetical protein
MHKPMFISYPHYAGKNQNIKIGNKSGDVIKLKYSEKNGKKSGAKIAQSILSCIEGWRD